MSGLLLALPIGVVAGLVAFWLCRGALLAASLERPNYRGVRMPTAGGIVLVVALLLVEAVLALLHEIDLPDALVGSTGSRSWAMVTLLSVGFGLLGLLDDVAGVGESGGFRRHVGSLLAGRPTSGGLKLVGGALVALVAVSLGTGRSSGWLLADAALVALAANFANLLDRAPGRTLKVSLVCVALLVIVAGGDLLSPVLVIGGAAVVLLVLDLGERLMLGDTGANVVGAVVGAGVVLSAGGVVRVVVLALLLCLNLSSEVLSFSKVIEGNRLLGFLDRLGSPHR